MAVKRFITCIAIAFTLTQSVLAQSSTTLIVGDNVPEFKVEKWLKGGNSNVLEKGKVYVIDLWATWCVPCIAGMPHLSKLQQKYKAQGLEIIGITSEDKWGNTLQKVEVFIKKKDSIMNYSVAWVPASMNKDSLQGIFVHPWMQQIGSMNLPTAFIIDRNGKIAFIGDPHTIDKPLHDIVNNQYDLSLLKANYKEALEALKVLDKFTDALKSSDVPRAISEGKRILEEFTYVKPVTYLAMADAVPKMKGEPNAQLLDIALAAGKKGVVLTQFESPGFLSALASVYAAKGDYTQAVITIKAAISVSEGGMKEAQLKDLEKYLSLIK